MKIAFIGGRDSSTLGGIENYVYNLSQELLKRQVQVLIFCEGRIRKKKYIEKKADLKIVYWPAFPNRFICKPLCGLLSTLYALFIERNCDVFHYNTWAPALLSSWLPAICGKFVIIQMHGEEWGHTKYTALQKKILKWIEKIIITSHRHVLSVSKQHRQYYIDKYGYICKFLPCAVHVPNLLELGESFKKYNLQKNGYYLFLGRLAKVKNPLLLIQAYEIANLTNRKLVIAGVGAEQEMEYVDQIREIANKDKRVILTGAVYGSDKDSLFENCFAFCLPSSSEGMSITLLEAMSYKKICIVSDIPSNRYLVGNNSLCVPLNVESWVQAFQQVETNPKCFFKGIEKNYNIVLRNYTWEKISMEYLSYIFKYMHMQNSCENEYESHSAHN